MKHGSVLIRSTLNLPNGSVDLQCTTADLLICLFVLAVLTGLANLVDLADLLNVRRMVGSTRDRERLDIDG